MDINVKGPGTAGFIVSEANGYLSRESVTVDGTAAALEAGTILGKVTVGGNYVRHAAGATNGSENEAGILYEGIGLGETAERTIVARSAEVNGSELIYEIGADATQITTSDAALAALGIIVRK
jgi:hypothetical protein